MEHEQERDDSVLDFAYVDRIRLSSLLAQLSDDGVVATAKRTSTASGSNSGSLKVTAAIVSVDGLVSDVASEALERSFDASMLLPINALTVLQEANMLRKGLLPGDQGLVPLGGLVHLKGWIGVRDVDMVRRLWQPMTNSIVGSEPKANQKAKREEVETAGRLLKDLPPTVQFAMLTDEGLNVWGLLNANDPTFSTHDMGLKHGSTLQGKWDLIGILDAYPEGPDYQPVKIGNDGGFLSMMAPMIDEFRKLLGRPAASFGVTPLALFRAVNDYSTLVDTPTESTTPDEP